MPIVCLHCRETIAQFLRRDTLLRLYELGDLDDFFWPYTTCYGLVDGGEIRQLAVVYTGTSCPTLLGLSAEPLEPMRQLLRGILPLLPRRLHAHLSGNLAEVFARDYQVQSHGLLWRMALVEPSRLEAVDASEALRLSPADREELLEFYRVSYPDNWFDPRMLETGQFFGLRREGRLVSVAGVHVYSPQYNAAALGSIATHPDFRGQGLATIVCARLCQSLRTSVTNLGLNVRCQNQAAIACYQRLGFQTIATYGEYTLEPRGQAAPERDEMDCRTGCGACCIAPSISSPIPGMPHGKPAGVRCVQLTDDHRCRLYGKPERPAVCVSLRAFQEMCGSSREEAIVHLAELERLTAPAAGQGS
jgi:ribosomal protein S18 acetylase RimI-like enzyme